MALQPKLNACADIQPARIFLFKLRYRSHIPWYIQLKVNIGHNVMVVMIGKAYPLHSQSYSLFRLLLGGSFAVP